MIEGLFQLVTKKPAPPHAFPPIWAARHAAASAARSGFEQIERSCPVCGLVRITVMTPSGARRFYRWGDARYQFEEAREPECSGDTMRPRKAG